jgi:chromosome segregation ATPase
MSEMLDHMVKRWREQVSKPEELNNLCSRLAWTEKLLDEVTHERDDARRERDKARSECDRLAREVDSRAGSLKSQMDRTAEAIRERDEAIAHAAFLHLCTTVKPNDSAFTAEEAVALVRKIVSGEHRLTCTKNGHLRLAAVRKAAGLDRETRRS